MGRGTAQVPQFPNAQTLQARNPQAQPIVFKLWGPGLNNHQSSLGAPYSTFIKDPRLLVLCHP